MNAIVNKYLTGYKFMPQMHSRHPGFTYKSCATFTKNKEKITNLKKQVIQDIFTKTNYIKLAFNMI